MKLFSQRTSSTMKFVSQVIETSIGECFYRCWYFSVSLNVRTASKRLSAVQHFNFVFKVSLLCVSGTTAEIIII